MYIALYYKLFQVKVIIIATVQKKKKQQKKKKHNKKQVFASHKQSKRNGKMFPPKILRTGGKRYGRGAYFIHFH